VIDDRVIDEGGAAAKTDDANDLRCVLHGPKIPGQIQAAEEIAGKQWADDPAFDTTDGLETLKFRIIRVQAEHVATVLFCA
jgi:hypothetical protein